MEKPHPPPFYTSSLTSPPLFLACNIFGIMYTVSVQRCVLTFRGSVLQSVPRFLFPRNPYRQCEVVVAGLQTGTSAEQSQRAIRRPRSIFANRKSFRMNTYK